MTLLTLRGQGIIRTVAGTDFTFPAQALPAIQAPLGEVWGVGADPAGNTYIADIQNSMVFKIDTNGMLHVVAGNGTSGYSGDGGPATQAALRTPRGVTADSQGNVYISDTGNFVVRKVTPDGTIRTIAGTGVKGTSADSALATKSPIYPWGLAVDSSGTLYIADYGSIGLRRLSADGSITTIGKPPLASQSFLASNPLGTSIDGKNNVFYCTQSALWKIAPDGTTSLIQQGLNVHGCAADRDSNVYLAGFFTSFITKAAPDGTLSAVAGSAGSGLAGDGGPASKATLNQPTEVAVGSDGTIYIADTFNHRVRAISQDGIIRTFAGNGKFSFSGDQGAATSATLNNPKALLTDSQGSLFVADTGNNRIRKITGDGIISTVAGNGLPTLSGDGGPASQAAIFSPDGLAADITGNLYIADYGNSRIRKMSTDGTITTLFNTGSSVAGSGNGTGANTSGPAGLASDASGNIYAAIPGSSDRRVLKIGPDGSLQSVYGSFLAPYGVALDSAGNVLIADTNGSIIARISPDGKKTTVAGNGSFAFAGDGGPANKASLNLPTDVAVDKAGNIYIADYSNNRVRKVTPDGNIQTVAGNGVAGFSGDGGPGASASLTNPVAVWADDAGNLFIADSGNNRIREILAAPPQVLISAAQLSFSATAQGALPPVQTVQVTSSAPGLAFSIQTTAPWLQVNPLSGSSPRLIEVTADPFTLSPGTYKASLTITTPNGTPASSTVDVTFTVGAAQTPKLAVDTTSLSFPFLRNGKPQTRSIRISNGGGGTLAYTVNTSTNSGAAWLSASAQSGTALPSAPATVTITADVSSLAPGTYTGAVLLSGANTSVTIPVTLTVSAQGAAISLSQTGLSFLGISAGGILPPQSFSILGTGGAVNFSVKKSTLSGGDWLQVSSRSGSSDPSAISVPEISVTANAAMLPPGKYYGLVTIDAPSAANSPQVVTVFLQVLPANSDLGAVAQPSEMLFAAPLGGQSPGSQSLLLYNIAAASKSFRAIASVDSGIRVLILPSDGTLDPQSATRIVVQPVTDGATPGVYNGTVNLQFSDGRVRTLRISIVVARASSLPGSARGADGCTPTKLMPALASLGQSFAVSAGWPVALVVDVQDDCGTPFASGSVATSFSTGDPPIGLTWIQNGRWQGTWNPQVHSSTAASLTITATDSTGTLTGKREMSGELPTQTDPPAFENKGVVSAASPRPFEALAPGSIISIFGDRLASGLGFPSSAQLPGQILDTVVLMGGESMPLYFVSPNQVNAQVPFDLNSNTNYQILIQQGLTYSLPVRVDVAPAQPAVFRDTTVSPDQAIAIVARPDQQFEAKPGTPAKSGDAIVIYAAGLGAVSPAVASGAPPGAALSFTSSPLSVTIGSAPAKVLFAGLAPGFVGLYQVNAIIPDGSTGDAVPLVLSISGQSSSVATIAIH